jgi:hypothetical protein
MHEIIYNYVSCSSIYLKTTEKGLPHEIDLGGKYNSWIM